MVRPPESHPPRRSRPALLTRIAHVSELANVISFVLYGSDSADFIFYSCRLNNKLKVRDIFVNNLVPELSNGVSRL